MRLVKLRCLTREARDQVVRDNPGSWGGYSVSAAGYKWYVYLCCNQPKR